MNKKMIFFCAVVLVIALFSTNYFPTVNAATAINTVRWEYTILDIAGWRNSGITAEANKLGEKGWELTGGSDTSRILIFKRMLQ